MSVGVDPNWQRLACFLQLSDLHIGVPDAIRGDAAVSKAVARAYGTVNWFDGMLGHHAGALEEIESLWASLQAEGAAHNRLLVVGDHSRTGDSAELKLAFSYLQSYIDVGKPQGMRVLGLRAGPVQEVIPGNHDHWSGSFIPLGAGPSLYQRVARLPTPFVGGPVKLANGRQVVICGIDSDADVRPWSFNRLLAHGSFESELQHPAAQPAAPALADDIRVMLVHHSWHEAHPLFLRMRRKSKQALGNFLAAHHFKVMLSGHSHTPLLQPLNLPHSPHVVHELRSGTAAQLDQVPAHWKQVWGKLPQRRWPPNGVLVHRLFDDGASGTHWQATIYQRGPHGFQPARQLPGHQLLFRV
jgi:hypothetical protein